ncbi:MAG: hypothetical protein GY866_36630 [Proteobacteria bacterium]|nr:hypothetical protein [Pseudomonadota bacterium]
MSIRQTDRNIGDDDLHALLGESKSEWSIWECKIKGVQRDKGVCSTTPTSMNEEVLAIGTLIHDIGDVRAECAKQDICI